MKQILTIIVLVITTAVLGWTLRSYLSNVSPSSTEGETSTIQSSKYDNINVKTIEYRDNDGRSLLNVAYPVTENEAVNHIVENFSQEFIDLFYQTAADQEEAYQKYLAETGMESYTTITHYTQHFDVSFADETYISFVFDRYLDTGGTGMGITSSKIFNRQTGTEIPLASLFTDEDYLKRLSKISRDILYKRAEETAKNLDGSEQAISEFIISRKQAIDVGTAPNAKNFDTLVVDESASLIIYFDKYQVGPGSDGIVEIRIPIEDIADIITPKLRELFSISKPLPPTTVIPPIYPESSNSEVDCGATRCVALSFDDGPSIYTNTLLDTLKEYDVPATFFVLGRSAKIQPDTILRIVQDGHELGNHTWSHRDLRSLAGDQIDEELGKTDDLLYSIAGIKPLYLRPPYGAFNDEVLSHIDRPIILWSVDPEDWKKPPYAELVRRMTSPQSGAIILAHDIHQSTVMAIPEVIRELKKQGFTFVTISDLLDGPLHAGTAYRHR
ncbi:MAG: polysaccharide deacetylase family protein [Patescibacteria group bacterium]